MTAWASSSLALSFGPCVAASAPLPMCARSSSSSPTRSSVHAQLPAKLERRTDNLPPRLAGSTSGASTLPDRLLCPEARQPIGDVEPRSLEVHEDMTLRTKSRIVVKCSGRDTDHVALHRRYRSTAYFAECSSIPGRSHAHQRLVGLDQRSPADP